MNLKTAAFAILVLYINSKTSYGNIDTSFCTPGGEDIEIPKLPAYFSTNIRINEYDLSQNEGYTRFIREMFDKDKQMGKMIETVYSKQNEIIYSRKDNSVFTVNQLRSAQESVCTETEMDKAKKNFEIWRSKFLTPITLLTKITTVLVGTKRLYKKPQPIVQDKISVVTNLWQSCFFDDVQKATFLIRYYWSNSTQWTGSDCDIVGAMSCPSVPVRLEISKKWTSSYSSTPSVRKETYEFSNFVHERPSPEIFQVPLSVYCKNVHHLKKFPTLPKSFSMSAEQLYYSDYDNLPDMINHRLVHYDEDFKLSFESDQKYFNLITDANNGLQYTKYLDQGTCVISAQRGDRYLLHSITFKNVSLYHQLLERLDLTNKPYSYNGLYLTEEQRAHVFVGKAIIDEHSVIIEWHFHDKNNSIGDPMKVVRRFADNGYQGRYELKISQWNSGTTTLEAFNIINCFTPNQTHSVTISFVTMQHAEVMKEPFCLHQLRVQLCNVAKVNVLRITSLKVKVPTSRTLELEFTLLETSQLKNSTNATNNNEESNLHDAIAALQDKFLKHQFQMDILTLKKQTITIKATSVLVGREKFMVEVPKIEKIYPIGPLVGSGAGMLFLGALIGAVVCYSVSKSIIKRKLRSKTNSDNSMNAIVV